MMFDSCYGIQMEKKWHKYEGSYKTPLDFRCLITEQSRNTEMKSRTLLTLTKSDWTVI